MSQRLVCFALLASATSLLSYAGTARAQLPIFQPEAVLPAQAVAPVVGQPPSPAPEPPPAPTPSPAAPPGPALAPASNASPASSNPPQPAKTDVITEPKRPVPPPAADDDDDDTPDTSRHRHWYGWQTLSADGAAFTTLLIAGSLNGQGNHDNAASALAWTSLLSYELTPGIIHFVHRNPGRAFASMGLRLGMPLTGAFIGLSAASGCNDGIFCEVEGAGIGVLLGMAGAVALDAALLAYDDPRPRQPNRSALVPLVSVTHHQAWIGVGGEL